MPFLPNTPSPSFLPQKPSVSTENWLLFDPDLVTLFYCCDHCDWPRDEHMTPGEPFRDSPGTFP